MTSKKIKLDTGSQLTSEEEPVVRVRKIPAPMRTDPPIPQEEVSGLPSSSEEKKKKLPTLIDVTEDVFKRIRKEMGLFKFIPLSTGKLQDLWWRPTQVSLVERSKGLSPQMLNVHTEILIDSCPNLIAPITKNMEAVFRTDVEELLTIAFLIDRIMKELHSEKIIKYDVWMHEMCKRFRCEDPANPNPIFAKQVMEFIMGLACTRVPKTFQLFLCKKPTWTYVFPSGCSYGENRNSIPREAPSGFKYEYRGRFFICDVPEIEELSDDDDLAYPESQSY